MITQLDESDHVVVIPDKDRWMKKAYLLMTAKGPEQRVLSKIFHRVMRDGNRAMRLQTSEESFSAAEFHWMPTEDVYLVAAYVAAGADLLVTSDRELFDALKDCPQVACMMREDFLRGFETRMA